MKLSLCKSGRKLLLSFHAGNSQLKMTKLSKTETSLSCKHQFFWNSQHANCREIKSCFLICLEISICYHCWKLKFGKHKENLKIKICCSYRQQWIFILNAWCICWNNSEILLHFELLFCLLRLYNIFVCERMCSSGRFLKL
jgi:hypothetical protein